MKSRGSDRRVYHKPLIVKGASMSFQSDGQSQPAINISNVNPFCGRKRLASCREELEQSWRGIGCGGGGVGVQMLNNLRCISYDGPVADNDDEDETMMISGSENSSRVKRRKTLLDMDDNSMTATPTKDESCSFVRGHRISSTYCRPPRRVAGTQVKAGWYEGSIDAFGNRHGRGVTRHDDGSEYEGPYVDDVMEGVGKYKFITEYRLVPDTCRYGSTLHRQIEKSFEGNFEKNEPHGAGVFVTQTVDCAPQVLGSDPPLLKIRFMEVVYDVGMYKNTTAVGEGVRIIYSATNIDGRSTLEKCCYRLMNGENTKLKVANDYATWVCHCLGMADIPVPSFSM